MGHATATPCARTSCKFSNREALDLLDEDGKPVSDMSIVSKTIDEELEEFLRKAAQTAVLMG